MVNTKAITDQDPAAGRRRYVHSMARTFASASIGCVLVIVGAFAPPYGLWISLARHNLESLLPSILSFLPFCALACYGVKMVTRAKEQRQLLAYVPAVRDQLAVMPAESLLVRSAERPDPLPEEMLRACASDGHPPAHELVRAGEIGDLEVNAIPPQCFGPMESVVETQEA
jgi:hypothetical protein